MDLVGLILVLAFPLGLYMAWNIGANDVANSFGTSVGSGAITLRQALLIAAIFELLGAILVGGHVTQTIRKGIVNPTFFSRDPQALVLGMLAALLAAATWVHLATSQGLPVSTTHSIVGAVVGFGIAAGGTEVVIWDKFVKVVLSWITSPLCGGLVAFLLFTGIRFFIFQRHRPGKAMVRAAPVFSFLIVLMITTSFLCKGSYVTATYQQAWIISIGASLAAGVITLHGVRRIRWPDKHEDSLTMIERVFKYIQVLTACSVAFAHGSNDVANAAGPIAAILSLAGGGDVGMNVPVPGWLLLLMGAGIVLGLATWGYRVIETVGRKITEMTPSRGFSAEFGTAATVLICSKLGFPISTTHTLVGAVIGVGFARGISALNFRIIGTIVSSWVITVPFAALLAMLFFWVLNLVA